MTSNRSRLDEAPDVGARFARALGTEPPFELPLGDALDAAVHGGRRRRARAIAARTLTAAACTVVVVAGTATATAHLTPADAGQEGAGVIASASQSACKPGQPTTAMTTPSRVKSAPKPGKTLDGELVPVRSTKVAGGTSKAAPCPVDSPAPADGSTDHAVPEISPKQLVPLARTIAAPRGGSVSTLFVGRDETGVPDATVESRGPAGAYDVTVTVSRKQVSPRELIEGCSPQDADSKPCHVELQGSDEAAVSTTFSDGSGRADLIYVADAGDGRTIWIAVDNYTEQPDGRKLVGPTWQQAGVTPELIRAAIAQSGLFD